VSRLLAVTATLAIACGAASAAEPTPSGQRALSFLTRLVALGPRPAGSAAELRADDAVATALRAAGFHVVVQPFRIPSGASSRNVVGVGDGPIRVILVAHLDGVAGSVSANDNGSGVAALVEAARVLGPRPGLLVAALGAEERISTHALDHLGSLRLLRGLSDAARRRAVALSLDMVGRGTYLAVRGLEPRPNRSARLALARARELGLRPVYLIDTGSSDHRELTRGGLPSAWLEWRVDPCFDKPCDTLDRVSARRLEQATRVAVAFALG
jgi:hypothetical protein